MSAFRVSEIRLPRYTSHLACHTSIGELRHGERVRERADWSLRVKTNAQGLFCVAATVQCQTSDGPPGGGQQDCIHPRWRYDTYSLLNPSQTIDFLGAAFLEVVGHEHLLIHFPCMYDERHSI